MKTLHSGTNEFPYVKTEIIKYSWKFEQAQDHEHPYILSVTVAGHTHSEGCGGDIGAEAVAVKAEVLAREAYEASRSRS
jgi:hypothetical protein